MTQQANTTLDITRIRRRPRWPWGVAVVAVLAVAAGASAYVVGGESATNWLTTPVTRGSIDITVTAVGSLRPKDYVDVGTQVSGQIKRVHVEIGDRVEKGDLLVEIDARVYESTVRKDRANLDNLRAQQAQREAELDLARRQLERNRNMFAAKAVSQDVVEELDAAVRIIEAQIAGLDAQIEAAEATLEGNLASLGYTRIHAPLAGTITAQELLEGQTVNSVQSAPTIVTVANMDVMTVWAQVAEADINRIVPDSAAYFTTLGMPERRWEGRVRQIRPTPDTETDVVLYNVLVDVDNDEGLLLPSMTAQVSFVLQSADDVPLVSRSALRADPEGDRSDYRVSVLTAAGPVERRVRIGLANRNVAEVASGLEIGDRVIIGDAGSPVGQNTRGANRFGARL